MRFVLILSLALVVACSSPGVEAEKRYERIRAAGATSAELCSAGREVERAWLDAKDDAKYRDWKLRADIDCLYDETKRRM